MISPEEKVGNILATIFGNEVYPVVHPDPDGLTESVTTTFAIYSKVGGYSFNKLDGDAGMSRVRMQVSVYAPTYGELKDKEQAVNDAMEAANTVASQAVDSGLDPFEIDNAFSNISATVPTDGYDYDTKRFYLHMEYYTFQRG